jgi:ER membrane protein complex subunit 1
LISFSYLKVVHTQAKISGDHDVMYKYLSKNLVFVATLSPKAAVDIGSALPEEASLVAYLIDAVTGRILHRVTHHGAQGPVHAVSIPVSSSLLPLAVPVPVSCDGPFGP